MFVATISSGVQLRNFNERRCLLKIRMKDEYKCIIYENMLVGTTRRLYISSNFNYIQ